MFEGFVVRGLLSMLLSRGPETIVEEINLRWPGSVDISDHGWAVAWFSNVPWLISKCRDIKKRGKKLVLVGHSFGGTAIIMIAQALAKEGIEVDLLCPIDTAYQYTTAVPPNCKRVVGFYQHTPGQLGQGEIVPAKGWTKQEWSDEAHDYHRYETHLQIVNDPFVHKTILNEIGKLK
jgi:hypothetical protein